MYAITGVTGHVGGAAARTLLATGAPVRVVVRGPAAAREWSERGAQVAVADLTDRTATAAAFAGCDGAFVMLPTVLTGSDADHRDMADALAAAVDAGGVPHVVMLSSVGADLPDGTGPIRWLHHLEAGLRSTGATVSAIRAPHFQENVETALDAAAGAGIYPVLGDPDQLHPQVATRDIGDAVADALLSPPQASEVVDLGAPSYTERQVADELGAALGRELDVVTVPRSGWHDALTGAGVPPQMATELVGLHDATQRGLLHPRGDRTRPCTTTLDETVRRIVAAAAVGDAP